LVPSLIFAAMVLVVGGLSHAATIKTYQVTLDEYDQVRTPPIGEIHSNTGGVGGVQSAGDWEYTFNGSSCKATLQSGSKAAGGVWYTLLGKVDDKRQVDFGGIFRPYIKPEYQGKVVAVELVVSRVESPKVNKKLQLLVEIKEFSAKKKTPKTLNPKMKYKLLTGDYSSSRVFRYELKPSQQRMVNQVVWSVKNALKGDSITVDRVRLEVQVPELAPEEEAFLWSYSWLMGNYDPITGMVQDKSWDLMGASENVAATAKAAKATCYAYLKGYVERADAISVVTKIAGTLLNDVVRGPAGKNTLWPHYTQNGGTEIAASSEWPVAETVYAAMDMITALRMIGDPESQIDDFQAFLQSINYSKDLLVEQDAKQYLSYGYYGDGAVIPYAWTGFGMETFGVNWAYAAVSGIPLEMAASPSDNGCGFIDNAAFPQSMTGIDRWGNDWDTYRASMAALQTQWYCLAAHSNKYFCSAGLFGLSAAEHPDGASYREFGVGGTEVGEDDGDAQVVVLHYPAMIADLLPDKAENMWVTLRDRSGLGTFLGDRIILSPLNNMESMQVIKDTGAVTVNHLKGSWNLALQTEGWALGDAFIRSQLTAAINANTFLKNGLEVLKP
jgi:hypothetical protein